MRRGGLGGTGPQHLQTVQFEVSWLILPPFPHFLDSNEKGHSNLCLESASLHPRNLKSPNGNQVTRGVSTETQSAQTRRPKLGFRASCALTERSKYRGAEDDSLGVGTRSTV